MRLEGHAPLNYPHHRRPHARVTRRQPSSLLPPKVYVSDVPTRPKVRVVSWGFACALSALVVGAGCRSRHEDPVTWLSTIPTSNASPQRALSAVIGARARSNESDQRRPSALQMSGRRSSLQSFVSWPVNGTASIGPERFRSGTASDERSSRSVVCNRFPNKAG